MNDPTLPPRPENQTPPQEQPLPPQEKSLKTSSRSTALVMIGTGLSRVMGYVRVFVFAYIFGNTPLADVVNAVIRIPESMRSLFAEGALSSAFIPTLSTALVQDPSGERARRIVSNLFAFIFLLLVPLCTLGVVFNTQVVGVITHFQDTRLLLSASADGSRLAAAADDGSFHFSSDGGEAWTDRPGEHKWASVALSADGTTLLGVVKDGPLFRSDYTGAAWRAQKQAGERPWSAVALSRTGAVTLAAADGWLGLSRDGGRTWEERAESAGVARGDRRWEGGRRWTAAAVSADGLTIAVGEAGGALLLSRDGGAAFRALPGEAGRSWTALSLSGDGRVLMGAGSDGYLYRSDDQGATWAALSGAGKKAWSTVALSADGGLCLAGVSEGSYFASRDGGRSWAERKGAGVYRWKTTLAEQLFPYDVWFILFISLSAILMGALNSRHSFVIPALTPILFSATVIAALLWLPFPLEYRIITGIVSGGVAQVLFQIPSFLRARYRLLPDFRFNNADFKRVLVQWLPVVASASIFAINSNIATAFASTLEPGSISAFQYAIIYFQLPVGIFVNSVITVVFPRLSRQAALQNIEGLKDTLAYGLRFMLLLLVPSTLLLVFLGEDVITLTLQHGAFTRAGTLMTSSVLAAFCVGLYATGAVYLFQRLFYALKDYKWPLISAGVMLAVDVGASLLLMRTPLRVAGLALASSLSFTVGLALFIFLARRRLGPLGLKRLAADALKVLAGNVPPAVLIAAYIVWVRPAAGAWAIVPRFIVLGGFALAAFGSAAAMYLILKIDIVEDIIKGNLKKLREKLRRK